MKKFEKNKDIFRVKRSLRLRITHINDNAEANDQNLTQIQKMAVVNINFF